MASSVQLFPQQAGSTSQASAELRISSPAPMSVHGDGYGPGSEVFGAVERGDEAATLAWLVVGGEINMKVQVGSVRGITLLMTAARHGHERLVGVLLGRNAGIQCQDSDGESALMIAIAGGHEVIAYKLLACGADLALRNNAGRTALMVAAGKGLGETVKRLLQRGADANQKNKDGGTAMMYAANAEVLGLLLKHGGEVNLQDLRGSTALMLAAGSGQEQIVELLLQSGADVDRQDNDGGTALIQAAIEGNERIIEMLCLADADLELQDAKGVSVLMYAVIHGHEGLVQMLLEMDQWEDLFGQQDVSGKTALIFAAFWNRPAIVRHLLESSYNIRAAKTQRPSFALQMAKEQGHVACVEILEKHLEGLMVMAAAERGDAEAVRAWLDGGGQASATFELGYENELSLLMIAADNGCEEVVDLLLQSGAEVDQEDSDGRTALQMAKRNGHAECVRVLEEHLAEAAVAEVAEPEAATAAGASGAAAGAAELVVAAEATKAAEVTEAAAATEAVAAGELTAAAEAVKAAATAAAADAAAAAAEVAVAVAEEAAVAPTAAAAAAAKEVVQLGATAQRQAEQEGGWVLTAEGVRTSAGDQGAPAATALPPAAALSMGAPKAEKPATAGPPSETTGVLLATAAKELESMRDRMRASRAAEVEAIKKVAAAEARAVAAEAATSTKLRELQEPLLEARAELARESQSHAALKREVDTREALCISYKSELEESRTELKELRTQLEHQRGRKDDAMRVEAKQSFEKRAQVAEARAAESQAEVAAARAYAQAQVRAANSRAATAEDRTKAVQDALRRAEDEHRDYCEAEEVAHRAEARAQASKAEEERRAARESAREAAKEAARRAAAEEARRVEAAERQRRAAEAERSKARREEEKRERERMRIESKAAEEVRAGAARLQEHNDSLAALVESQGRELDAAKVRLVALERSKQQAEALLAEALAQQEQGGADAVPARPLLESEECAVCMVQPRTHALLNCGHRCVCQGCAQDIVAGKATPRGVRMAQCPVCRSDVDRAIYIYD